MTIETNDDQSCVWVRGDTGRTSGQRVAIMWPEGYFARFDPLRLYNADGDMIWHGDEVGYIWAFVDYGHRDHLVHARCRTDDVLVTDGRVRSQPRQDPHATTTTTTTTRSVLLTSGPTPP